MGGKLPRGASTPIVHADDAAPLNAWQRRQELIKLAEAGDTVAAEWLARQTHWDVATGQVQHNRKTRRTMARQARKGK